MVGGPFVWMLWGAPLRLAFPAGAGNGHRSPFCPAGYPVVLSDCFHQGQREGLWPALEASADRSIPRYLGPSPGVRNLLLVNLEAMLPLQVHALCIARYSIVAAGKMLPRSTLNRNVTGTACQINDLKVA